MFSNSLIVLISSLMMLTGIVGAVLPIIPGPIICYAALWLLHFTDLVEFSPLLLLTMGVVTIVVSILDFIVPAWGTRKLGGSQAGVWGSTIGLFAGMFLFPPFGIIFGPIAGAMIAELIRQKDNFGAAIRSGLGSFLGFLAGTGLKLMAGVLMSSYFIKALF